MDFINFNVFKGGARMCVTFSYDDGKLNDIRLCELLKKYGLKGTFNLNSCNIGKDTYINEDDVKKMVSDGFEVAIHAVNHPNLETLSDQLITAEILEDKRYFEKLTGKIITGMAYPFGTYDDRVIRIAKSCGIKYSRTTKYNAYKLPSEFLEWHSTCHHRDMAKFVPLQNNWWHQILYVWGHSYEFNSEEVWAEFEENLKKIAFKDDIWYATNGEICEYVNAQKSLEFSADGDMVYNPTAIDVYINVNWKPVLIKAGETVKLR